MKPMANDRSVPKDLGPIDEILARTAGGVYKRIDENRKLLELLQSECPSFLKKHSWVESWLECNDDFFVALAVTAQVREALYMPKFGADPYPRPWPASGDADGAPAKT